MVPLPGPLDVPVLPDALVDEPPPPDPLDEPDPDDPELLVIVCESTRAWADVTVSTNPTTAQARARALDLIITGPLSPTGSRLV